jgi:hypothetical protein
MDQHVLGGLDSAQLDVERDEIRTSHRGARHDPLTLELSRAHVQRLEPPRAIGLAIDFVHDRLVRAVGRHVVPIRGPGPPFKARASIALV